MSLFEIAYFVVGFVALIGGADVFVRGASAIAIDLRISPVIVGLTVVAFGTSAPELAVTLESVAEGRVDVAVGNVLGSNIANILVILGLSAMLSPISIHSSFLRFEIPLLIFVSFMFWMCASDGSITRLEGGFLFGGAIAYTLNTVRNVLKERSREKRSKDDSTETNAGQLTLSGVVRNMLLIGIGFVLLVVGSKGIVSGAVKIAVLAGMDELVVGLTIVAIGTSLPEIAMSIIASRKNEGDMAIGNVVGSNMFNILVVIGLGALFSTEGLAVSRGALSFDFPFMCAVAVGLLPAAFSGSRIDRREGLLFLGFYIAYTIYLILDAQGHAVVPEFTVFTFYFCGPLAILALGVSAWRSFRSAS